MSSKTQFVKADGRKWFELLPNQPAAKRDPSSSEEVKRIEKNIQESEIRAIEKNAEKLLEADTQFYTESNLRGDSRSDFLWMNKVMKSGTLPDRMAAFTVRIQDSPVHNIQCLQQLIAQVKVQGKQQCLMTAETLKELFLEDLLPPERKLQRFEQHQQRLRTDSKKQLILWLYEDRLKSHYANFVQALGKMAGDTVDKLRGKAISIMQQLLTRHPEQESVLLQMLVNKLGDPVQKVASRALYHLNQLILDHPRMKMVVVEEVERLLFRNNVGKKAQYYGICFLNLIRLEDEHPQLSLKLVKVYLAFFKACIKQGEIDSKLMSALLTGVNRAFPKAKMLGFEITESIDTLYKIVRLSQFNISIQALSLLLQMIDVQSEGDGVKADRFYRNLYEKLLDPEVATTAHGMKFLNLLHKSMKIDSNLARIIAFSKRLLQVCHNVPPNIACGILYLLSDISKLNPGMFKLGSNSPEVLTSEKGLEDETMEENGEGLVGNDGDTVEGNDQSDQQLNEKNRKKLEKFIRKSNVRIDDDDDGDIDGSSSQLHDEFNDCKFNSQPTGRKKKNKKSKKSQAAQENGQAEKVEPEVVAVKDELIKTEDSTEKKVRTLRYDAVARNPAYCGADLTLAFELVPLTQHFHPSVALFAKTLLEKNRIKYDGNPLRDFTVGRFLERFIYRNAKVNKLRPQYEPHGLRKLAVNSSTYLQADESLVPVEERFFYKYFKGKRAGRVEDGTERNVKEEDDSDIESVDDEEFEQIMGNYFKANGALESDNDDNEELDFASNIKTKESKKKNKGKKKLENDEGEEEDDEEDDEMEEDDDEDDMGEFDDAYENSDLDDEEAIDADDFIELGSNDEELDLGDNDSLDDEDDFGELDTEEALSKIKTKIQTKGKLSKPSKMKKLGALKGDMFAPAEQFSEMLDSNAELDLAGSHTFINKDNANVKQLKWESERDRWVKGYKRSAKTSFKSRNSKKKRF